MLHWFAQRRRGIGRRVIAGLGLAWSLAIVAPCVMAASDCRNAGPMPDCPHAAATAGHEHLAMTGCDTLMQLDCQKVDDGMPGTAAVDAPAALPVLLHTLPVALAPAQAHHAPYYSAADALPRPPLIILNLRLLI
jgi:hypothetical protein